MSKNKKTILNQIYQYDESDKSYIVDVSLDKYVDIFNEWDAAPIRKKSIDPALESFIDEASFDIPLKHKLKIIFELPLSLRDEKKENLIKDGFRNYYYALLHFLDREMRINYRKIFFYVFLGFSFIIASTFMDNLLSDNQLFIILSQGVFVGGWVLLWESFSLFFFEMYEKRDERKRYLRLISSKITYKYIKNSTQK